MSATTAAAPVGRLLAYSRLAKLTFYDYYLAAPVVWTLLPGSARTDGRVLATLVVATLGWVAMTAATVAFDDAHGFQDGSDHANYDPSQSLRNRKRKPLLNGDLTLRQAMVFGYGSLVASLGFLALAAWIAPHRTAWAVVLIPVQVAISVQYSHGLRLSYRGGQELVLLASPALMALIPYGLTDGRVSGTILLEAYLIGVWSLLVSVYSNANDREGDAAAGRKNLATLLSPRAYLGAIALISLSESAALLAAWAAGAVPGWFVVCLLPVLVMRARQADSGLRKGDPLLARKLGVDTHRLGVAALLVANLLVVR
ncbi:UbiA family prenyltransferase [Streptomyces beihaiensis]|uniref:UbiA family prenyltransferase n=1 Tax=Streptomyces beihaiensis TaxID=2984495 RepID=A0ABT3TSZ6_9ACTN|nr:UbiA family prenyltransferase [Streptomyces beihaiensis]MCX3059910.1 UbiA family prenyltransferase [Streptomyces beihaiensis]